MRIPGLTTVLAVFVLSLGLLQASAAHAQNVSPAATISEIRVDGNKRIDAATIEAYLPLRAGQAADPVLLNAALESLFATNLFTNVSIAMEAGVLVVTVEENPIINRISLEGNDVLDDEVLLEYLDLQPRRVFTRQLALDAKQQLIEIYRQGGRYAATVEPQIIALPDNRVDLVFEIDEGPLIKIDSIRFIGNEVFSDRALKNVILSRERKWYLFLARNDKYEPARLAVDSQRLRQFYLSNGYADIDVVRATGELLPDRSGFVLSFLIEEGQQYTVDGISFTSELEGIDTTELVELAAIAPGDVYDVRAVEQGLLDITNKLGEFGYAFVDVTVDPVTDTENATLSLEYAIGEARRNFVEEIAINGNDRTLDSVVRREFELVEGDSFNRLKLSRSERNIRNLGYFSDVQLTTMPGSSADQTIVNVDVKETATGTFQIGLGYSTFDKGSFGIGISENNFLGTGRGARASLDVSQSRSNFRIGITEPYLLERNLSGSADLFKTENKTNGIKVERLGTELGAGFSAANDYFHNITYRLANSKTTVSSTTSTSTSGDEGTILISEISYRLTQDKRDNRFDPRDGYMWRISEGVAGIGGDSQYLRSEIEGQIYYPFLYNRLVVGLIGEAGLIDGLGEKVTRSNRFVLGGNSVRGFNSGGIGPRDSGDLSAVGGNKYVTLSANIYSDLGFDQDFGARWTVFADAGSLWDTDYPVGVNGADDSSLRTSVGFGILWDTPIGPLTFYWANAINKESYDKTKTFQFRIGGRF